MFDGHREKYRQTVIRHLLVFNGAAHHHIVVTIAPIAWYAIHKAVDSFGEKEKQKVAPLLNHLPTFWAPRVGIFQEEIRRKTSENNFAAFDFPTFVASAFDWEVEIASFPTFLARNFAAVHLVLTIDITVFASGADFGATVPRIPIGVCFPMLGHD